MNDVELRNKTVIKNIVDSPLFNDIFKSIEDGIAREILNSPKEEDRDRLYHEAKALERLRGQLTAIANEVRMDKKDG